MKMERIKAGFFISTLLVLSFIFQSCTTTQKLNYKINGQIANDSFIFVASPTRYEPEGYRSEYFFFDNPQPNGMVEIQTINKLQTKIGYISPQSIPVDCYAYDPTSELNIVPIEKSHGIAVEWIDISITNSPQLGLRLIQIDPELRSIKFRLLPEPDTKLYKALNTDCSFAFFRQGDQINMIEQSGYYVLVKGSEKFLLGIHSRAADAITVNAFKQKSIDDPVLLLDNKWYLDKIQTLMSIKNQKK